MRVIFHQFKDRQSGQTLIDVMLALALLSSAVASAGSISTLSSRVGDEAGRRSQAVALAERELEGLRQYRTQTLLSPGKTWANVFTSTCYTFVMQLDNTGTWRTSCVGSAQTYVPADDSIDANIGTQYTGFSRLVTIKPNQTLINAYPSNSLGTSATPDTNDMLVEVNVTWNEANGAASGQRNVTLHSVIANWRQQ